MPDLLTDARKVLEALELAERMVSRYGSGPTREQFAAAIEMQRRLVAALEGAEPVALTDTSRIDGLVRATDEGYCPVVIFDDNGHWAVTDEGYQNVPSGDAPEDIEVSHFVVAAKWKGTIRDAIDSYLSELHGINPPPQTPYPAVEGGPLYTHPPLGVSVPEDGEDVITRCEHCANLITMKRADLLAGLTARPK